MSNLQKYLDDNLSYIFLDDKDEQQFALSLKKQIADVIKKIRTKKKLSQKELSAAAGMTQASISHIENETSNMTIEQLERIFKALDAKPRITVEDFEDGKII